MKQRKFLFSGAAVLLTAALILSGRPNPSDNDPSGVWATINRTLAVAAFWDCSGLTVMEI